MDKQQEIQRFQHLTFESFKELAKDDALTPYQKIGFPNSYRQGIEPIILEDIIAKMPILRNSAQKILDIGPGCSDLIQLFITFCEQQQHDLTLIDSVEMLNLLPDCTFITKCAGHFPSDFSDFLAQHSGQFNAIISYSVMHYVFSEGNLYNFIDKALGLLAEGGMLLLGDLPNHSKRQRFFATPTGVRYHQAYTQSDTLPEVTHYEIPEDKMDDGILFGILQRYRLAGFETYLLPQPANLPMSNRREDILIVKT